MAFIARMSPLNLRWITSANCCDCSTLPSSANVTTRARSSNFLIQPPHALEAARGRSLALKEPRWRLNIRLRPI